MKRQQITCITLFVLLLFLTGCRNGHRHYVIGVSQCSDDIWREKQNAELRMGAYLHENVELRFAAAYDSDQRQVQQIDSLVEAGIDLLIVAPNQVQTISPAIDRAYDRGIPVIVFERKTSSQKYTAFISADNYEMGRQMGEYIASQLHGKGRVLEIMGLKGSSPAIERHNGFMDALKGHQGIQIVATLQGDWTEQSAYEATQQWLDSLQADNSQKPIDYVFGQNDRMAMGARRALKEKVKVNSDKFAAAQPDGIRNPVGNYSLSTFTSTLFCGIDGLPGDNGGIRLVRDSILDASYIYPTHGDQIIDLAINILEGKPYEKETMMMSAIVTSDNANVLLMQSDEMMRQSAWLDELHEQADTYLHQLDTQRTVTLLAGIVIALLLIAIVLFYLYHVSKVRLQHERVVNTLWEMDRPSPQPLPEMEEREQSQDSKAEQEEMKEASKALPTREVEESSEEAEPVSTFIIRFKEVIESKLDDSDLSVEDLAALMNLSRVQLYRKVKSCTGATPVELLRKMRLKRGYQLLATTDKTVSEVAYMVGFTAPSYFTKCFKDEYGMLPGEIRQN